MKERESFKFPSNVKQIGSIDDDMKIYVEDYAYTYICQYARSESYSEKVAALVGEYIEVEGKRVTLISGIIQGKYSESISGNEIFTEETWEYIRSRKERYFKDFDIVGWLHTQSGSGTFVSEDDKKFHEENFTESYQVLFIMDSVERMDTFFVWDNKQEKLRELKGYFIYYDRNENMQEYMLDNKLVKSRAYDYVEEEKQEKQDVIVNYRRQDKMRREELHQKKVVNMLVGTSGIVVVLCFLMGLLLVQNSERMNKLEAELINVNDIYGKMALQTKDEGGGAKAVFASQDTNVQQLQSEPSSEEEINAKVTEAVTQPSTQQAENISETIEVQTQATKETQAVQPTKVQETTESVKETIAVVETTKKETTSKTHVVKEGDSLSWISTYYYGTNKMINKIMEYNNIKDPDKVTIGMTIKLPEKSD